jgi:hypothetical protein
VALIEPAGPGDPAAASPGPWWSRPASRVGLLTALMTLAAAGVVASYARDDLPVSLLPGGAWWVAALGVLCALTEGFAVHVRVRRGAHAIGLSEFPMVLGLLVFHPAAVIVTRALAGGAGLMLLRRQRGGKLAFNMALLAVQASVAVLVFHLIAPHALGATADGLDLRDWLATYAATAVADVVAVVLLTAVIAVHDDPGEWRRLPAALRSGWMVVVTTTVALVSFSAAVQARWALALVAVVAVVLFLAYRAYVQLGNGNAEVEQLYGFTRALDGHRAVDDLVPVVLDLLRDVLRAGTAELVLAEDGRLTHIRLTGPAAATVTEAGDPAADAWLLPALDGAPVLRPATPPGTPASLPAVPHGDGMAVPVGLGEDRAALVVGGSLVDGGTFTEARMRLF